MALPPPSTALDAAKAKRAGIFERTLMRAIEKTPTISTVLAMALTVDDLHSNADKKDGMVRICHMVGLHGRCPEELLDVQTSNIFDFENITKEGLLKSKKTLYIEGSSKEFAAKLNYLSNCVYFTPLDMAEPCLKTKQFNIVSTWVDPSKARVMPLAVTPLPTSPVEAHIQYNSIKLDGSLYCSRSVTLEKYNECYARGTKPFALAPQILVKADSIPLSKLDLHPADQHYVSVLKTLLSMTNTR